MADPRRLPKSTEALSRVIRARATQRSVAGEIMEKVGYDQALVAAEMMPPDDEAPLAPTGVIVTEYMRSVAVNWDQPPPTDQVVTTTVKVSRVDGTGTPEYTTVRTRDGGTLISIAELQTNGSGASAYKAVPASGYNVEVKHTDLVGLESGYAQPVTRIPNESTVDKIVADRILAGVLQAAVSVTAGGYIAAGGARLDSGGIELTEVAGGYGDPSLSGASKITPSGASPWGAIGFARVATSFRSVHTRVDAPADPSNEVAEIHQEVVENNSPSNARSVRWTLISAKAGGQGIGRLYGTLQVKASGGGGGTLSTDGFFACGGGASFAGALTIPAGSTGGGFLQDGTVHGNKLFGADSIPASIIAGLNWAKITGVSVTGGQVAANTLTKGQMADTLDNPAQGTAGFRSIGTFLGGNALQSSSANHSHGSGNSLEFDHLADAHKERVFLARRKLRARMDEVLMMDEMNFREFVWWASYAARNALAIEIDAPDLRAEERHAMRKRGEEFGEMFEYRRWDEIEREKQALAMSAAMGKGTRRHRHGTRLHEPHLRHYAQGHPDAE